MMTYSWKNNHGEPRGQISNYREQNEGNHGRDRKCF